MLMLYQFGTPFCRLLSGHSQKNHAGVFVAVFRHVRSLVARLMRVLHVSRGETAIALLQSSDCVSGGINRLIRLCRISSGRKLAYDEQAGDNEVGYELRLSHTGDPSETSRARSIRNSEANG